LFTFQQFFIFPFINNEHSTGKRDKKKPLQKGGGVGSQGGKEMKNNVTTDIQMRKFTTH
jgi:hypothetical protein